MSVPLVIPADKLGKPESQPTLVLVGASHPLVQQLQKDGKYSPPDLQPGEGLIQVVRKAFGEKSAIVVVGGDAAGLDRALAFHKPEAPLKIALFTAASETFSTKNTNASIAESIERFRPIVPRAVAAAMPIRMYISCAVACPFEGPIAPAQVRRVADMLLALAPDDTSRSAFDIDLGDTIGVAHTHGAKLFCVFVPLPAPYFYGEYIPADIVQGHIDAERARAEQLRARLADRLNREGIEPAAQTTTSRGRDRRLTTPSTSDWAGRGVWPTSCARCTIASHSRASWVACSVYAAGARQPPSRSVSC